MVFFFVFFFQLIVTGIQAIGIPGAGTWYGTIYLYYRIFLLHFNSVYDLRALYVNKNCIFLFFSGIITAISMFNSSAKGVFVGLLMLFIAICFLLAAGGDLLLLTKVQYI